MSLGVFEIIDNQLALSVFSDQNHLFFFLLVFFQEIRISGVGNKRRPILHRNKPVQLPKKINKINKKKKKSIKFLYLIVIEKRNNRVNVMSKLSVSLHTKFVFVNLNILSKRTVKKVFQIFIFQREVMFFIQPVHKIRDNVLKSCKWKRRDLVVCSVDPKVWIDGTQLINNV